MKKLGFLNFLKIGLLLFVFTIPLQNRDLFSVLGTRLFPARLILVVLIAVSGLFLIRTILASGRITGRIWELTKNSYHDDILRVLLLLWLVRLVSLKESLNIKASLDLFLFYTSMVALYVILKYLRQRDFRFIDGLLDLYVLTVSLIGIFGFAQAFLSLFGLRLPGVLIGSTFIRIPATFYDANHLAPYLLTALPLIWVKSFFEKDARKRFLLYVLVAVLSLVIVLTYSRSGIIGFGVVFLIFALYFIRNRYWRKLAFFFVILSLLALVVFVSSRTTYSLVKRGISVLSLQDTSTVAHGILLYGGFKLWLNHPILGVGYGGFSEAFRETPLGREHEYFDPATQVRLPIHSIWLETLAETGIIGFSLYLLFMLSIGETFWRAFRLTRNPQSSLFLLALFSSFVGILTSGIFYSYNLEFFWFFIFTAHFCCTIVLNERRAEASRFQPVTGEDLNWREIAPFILISSIAFPLLIYNLTFPLLSPGSESLFAVIAKTIRRTGGMGWPYWWIPKIENVYYFAKPPLFFYLNAFVVFLYDILTSAVRFWSAFFGFLSLIFVYCAARLQFDRKRSLVTALTLLALPGFLLLSRRGTFDPVVFFLASLLGWLYLESRLRKHFFLFLGLALSFAFLIYQQAALVFGLLFLGLVAVDVFFFRNPKRYKNFWLLTVPFLIFLVNAPWIFYAGRNFDGSFLRGYFSLDLGELGRISVLLLFPAVSLVLSRYLYRFKTFWAVAFLSFTAVFQLLLVPQSGHRTLIDLIQKRLETDRRGTIPLVMAADKSLDYYYYSEVPLIFVSGQKIWQYFDDDRAYFFILDGGEFRRMSTDLIRKNVATKVVATEHSLILVEKYGLIP